MRRACRYIIAYTKHATISTFPPENNLPIQLFTGNPVVIVATTSRVCSAPSTAHLTDSMTGLLCCQITSAPAEWHILPLPAFHSAKDGKRRHRQNRVSGHAHPITQRMPA